MSPLYQDIARLLRARANCLQTANAEWKVKHEANLLDLMSDKRGVSHEKQT